jgi:hypothetical protein
MRKMIHGDPFGVDYFFAGGAASGSFSKAPKL